MRNGFRLETKILQSSIQHQAVCNRWKAQLAQCEYCELMNLLTEQYMVATSQVRKNIVIFIVIVQLSSGRRLHCGFHEHWPHDIRTKEAEGKHKTKSRLPEIIHTWSTQRRHRGWRDENWELKLLSKKYVGSQHIDTSHATMHNHIS